MLPLPGMWQLQLVSSIGMRVSTEWRSMVIGTGYLEERWDDMIYN